jgi:Uma2 family endonuclease
MTVGNAHAWVIGALSDLNPKLKRFGCHIRVQLPLTLAPIDEPEPDGAIVVGSNDDYRDRHPAAADVSCVIEVADSSLRRDRVTKLRIYAGAKISCYVIINLVDRVLEIYTEPMTGKGRTARYGQSRTLQPGDKIDFPAPRGRALPIAVRKLLP